MLVTIEKYDIVKGCTYKRQFELVTNGIILENDNLTIGVFLGDFKELSILCRDKEQVDFISARFIDIHKEFTCYHFDTIKYYYDNDVKVLVRKSDEF